MCSDYGCQDITGIQLIPGKKGSECPGNGEHLDSQGCVIECCCDEYDYFLECFPEFIK